MDSSSSRHHRRSRDSRSRSPERSSKHRDRSDRDRDEERSSRRHHERSRSPKSRKHREKDSGSEGEERGPPDGVGTIDKDDFYLKASEFKVYLDEEKGKRLDQLKSDDARRYFGKFVKAWNRGQLAPKYYAGISSASISASLSSRHTWSFAKATQRELDDASSIRKSIDTGSRAPPPGPALPSFGAARGPTLGPSMPPSALSGLQQSREATSSLSQSARDAQRAEYKSGRREAREEERDNRATGRERLMEKRKEVGANMREMREARESGGMVEVSDDVLMGSGGTSDFKAMIAARDHRATHGRRAQQQEERQAVMSDKMYAYKAKEDATMAQFKALAEARFGK